MSSRTCDGCGETCLGDDDCRDVGSEHVCARCVRERFARAEAASRESREVTQPEMRAIGAALDSLAAAGDVGQAVLELALRGAAVAGGAPALAPLAHAVAERARVLVEGALRKARS